MPRPKNRNNQLALRLFQEAETAIVRAGYGWEIKWQNSRRFEAITEQDILRETAWVILCSGFRETAVRSRFDYISLCFCDWESAREISIHCQQCIATALPAFRNERKIRAIARVAEMIDETGFHAFRQSIIDDPIPNLQRLPFIGPVTSWHLAKNLGLDVAKNDRHLARLAKRYGYRDAHGLCEHLARATGYTRSVVDLILWRFATLYPQAVRAA